ncbi:SPL family radical SAM protein [Peptostreptococcus porci]|uniref:SPL family radical SAM protein n=1 Tax=Peptostreptococcus porci TaxID=2652282 RepID=UPI002A90CBE7|nr:radical SAM protein [Peptostreptococcus porci]MDY6232129.1 radical SAM protein [Peptostreptococcus porci]
MHFTKVKGILSSKNGMNLFRGCTHGCIYCDSRSKCYQMNHKFEDIEVKENGIILLEESLKRKRKKCMIGLGSMTDPYIREELQLNYTRKALELINRYGFGVTLITKSANVLRDLDLLKEINSKTKCVIQMTLTTYDEELCKKIEPNVSTTKERVEVLKILRDEGIPTVVWLTPILPFINDTKENILGILNYCKEANVFGIICFGMGLTLRDGNREYFYYQLDKQFPNLKERYIREYGNSYVANSKNNKTLTALFHEFCEQHNIVHDNEAIFNYLMLFEEKNCSKQISFFDEE